MTPRERRESRRAARASLTINDASDVGYRCPIAVNVSLCVFPVARGKNPREPKNTPISSIVKKTMERKISRLCFSGRECRNLQCRTMIFLSIEKYSHPRKSRGTRDFRLRERRSNSGTSRQGTSRRTAIIAVINIGCACERAHALPATAPS